MTEILQNGMAYFFRGIKDCILGAVKVYNLDKEATDDCSAASTNQDVDKVQQQRKPTSVLAQRRAASSPPKKPETKVKISSRVFQCCLWNGGIFWMSLLLFDYVFIPTLRYTTHTVLGGSATHTKLWSWMGPLISGIFSALWVLPLFIVSKVVNSLWFQDIAEAAWKTKKRRNKLPNIGLLLADMLFSILVQTLFLLQGMLANMLPLPLIGQAFSLTHLGILYSMYAFEYRWFNMGWSISKRVAQLEHQWPYFLGFGFPLAYLTWLPESAFISGCVFSILFPLLIIGANEAEPIAQKFDFPLHLFSTVMKISSAVFNSTVKQRVTGPPKVATESAEIDLIYIHKAHRSLGNALEGESAV